MSQKPTLAETDPVSPPAAELRIRRLRPFLIETFGKPVHRVSLDAGSTCPNRDGTRGRGPVRTPWQRFAFDTPASRDLAGAEGARGPGGQRREEDRHESQGQDDPGPECGEPQGARHATTPHRAGILSSR